MLEQLQEKWSKAKFMNVEPDMVVGTPDGKLWIYSWDNISDSYFWSELRVRNTEDQDATRKFLEEREYWSYGS